MSFRNEKLLIFASLIILILTHKGCIHDQITKNVQLTPIDDRINGRIMQANGYGPIRIHYVYNTTDIDPTDPMGKNIIKIMNIINLFWQKTIEVYYLPFLSFNVDASVSKTNFQCLSFTVPVDILNNPIPGKDFGILV
jgi:hypothetical protein